MDTTCIDGKLWILNNDGKNPFTDGTPQCLKGGYSKTYSPGSGESITMSV
jgi:hypothetical protein